MLVGRAGLEPATKGLCVPPRLSPPVSGSWSGLCLAFRPSRRVSTRSPQGASLGVGMAEVRCSVHRIWEVLRQGRV